jgi:hypothetical protein
MKKILFVLSLLLIQNGFNATALLAQPKAENKVKPVNIVGAVFPFFSMQLTDSQKTMLAIDRLDPTKSVVLMMFNPSCDHCVEQAKDIIANQDKYGETVFVLVTGDQMGEYLPDFYQKIGYNYQKNIYIGVDVTMASYDFFAFEGLPQLNIYGRDRKLIAIYTKEQKPSLIQAALRLDNSKPLTKDDLEIYLGNRLNILTGAPIDPSNKTALAADHPLNGKAIKSDSNAPAPTNNTPTKSTQAKAVKVSKAKKQVKRK